MAALPAGGASSGDVISTPEEIKSAQQHLKYMGYDVPEATGTPDTKTRSAVMKFQESIKAPVTGDLTSEQLQMLFMKVAGQSVAGQ